MGLGSPFVAPGLGELRASLAARDATIREMDHRIKNHLQLLLSYTRNLARQPGETASHMAAEIASRLNAVAAAHNALHLANGDDRAPAAPFLQAVCAPFIGTGPVVRLRCADGVTLRANQLGPLGMFLTEAIANALKHAFGDRDVGAVDVALERCLGRLRLSVRDDGAGMSSDAPTASGSGLRLLLGFARSLSAELLMTSTLGEGTGIELLLPRDHAAVSS